MKNWLLIFLLSFCAAFSQGVESEFIQKNPLNADVFVGSDNFGNQYFIKNNIFYKKKGLVLFQFNDFQLGKIENADILNPLKIILFYKNANTAVVLDNRLTEIERINFNEMNPYRNVGFASSAGKNSLWILNVDEQRVEIIDGNRRQNIPRTPPLRSEINAIVTNYNYCWVSTNKTLRKFNVYGVQLQELAIANVVAMMQDNNDLVFFQNGKLFFLANNSSIPMEINVPVLGVEQFYFKDEMLYIYNNQLIHQYKLKLPKKE